MSDLRITMQRRRLQSELKASKKPKRPASAPHAARPPPMADASRAQLHGNFPNLVALFKTRLHQRRLDPEANVELLRVESPRTVDHTEAHETASAASETSHFSMAGGSAGSDRPDRPDPDQSDPTLVAMAGANARHFVPEKLPWQVLRNITRVLQVCWFWSGLMAFLKEVHIYQVDFQQHPAGERRLCEAEIWSFVDVENVDWPHGSFFRAQGVFCAGDFYVASPFAVYQGTPRADGVQLEEVQRLRMPRAVSAACSPGSKLLECLLLTTTQDGLEIWPAKAARRDGVSLRLADRPWHLATGSTVPCAKVLQLLPPDEVGLAEWCLLLAGWDGQSIPIAAVPLLGGVSKPPTLSVRPGLDAPLKEDAKGTVALHLDSYGQLVALLSTGYIEAWDLFASRSLGRWRPQWPQSFHPVGFCQDENVGFLVIGHNTDRGGASISRSRTLPWNASFQAVW
eukprot:symbB.v1.2.032357.t1/scaffold3874.1/size48982/2